MFFTFEGIDGVGKSTQLGLFVEWLRSNGHDVVQCRDPGSTPLGESLREILLHSDDDRPIGPRSEMLLYMAARAQLVDEVIRPALANGSAVVSDRFLLSNLVYQAHAGGLDRESVFGVGEIATDGVLPDLVFLLDASPAEAERRRGREPDRMERRGAEYQEKLRQGFLDEAARDPKRILVIDATQDVDAIHQKIREAAERFGGD